MRNRDGARQLARGIVAGLLGVALVSAGTAFRSEGSDARAAESAAAAAPEAAKIAGDWPRPRVALVLSGEMRGYIEPCGCTEGQTGGLTRRATLVKELKSRGWPVVGFDLGGTMDEKRIGRLQTRMKFDHTRDAFQSMGIVSVGIGREEALLRQDVLLDVTETDKQKPGYSLRFLSANVQPYPTEDLGIVQKFRIIQIGTDENALRLAITSVLGPKMAEGIYNDDFFKIVPAEEALKEVVPQMIAQKPDLMILLSHCEKSVSEQLARQFPQFGLVVTAGGPEDPNTRPSSVGDAMFLKVGTKGKNVGLVGFYPGQQPALRYELVSLDGETFANDPVVDRLMQVYQKRLEDERPDLVDNANPPPHPSGRTFVGAEVCKECHTQAYDKWMTTGHAHAFESLATGRENQIEPVIDRSWDAECLACHVTGWHPQQAFRYESGFIDSMQTPHLLGNQCENCHGPGSDHVKFENGEGTDEQIEAERKRMWISKAEADQKLCRQCHDGDNDPHFDFESYWPKIEHPED